MQLQNWISSQFPKKVLLFAFFSRSRNPDEYFREIYLYCQNHIKDLAMATVSSLAPENYSMPGPCFQCAKNDISALTGVHIFCTIDTRERERESRYPQDAFVLAFQHSFNSGGRGYNFRNDRHLQEEFDGYTVMSRTFLQDAIFIKHVHEGKVDPRFIRRRRKNFSFVATGCPRIATIRKKLQELAHVEQDSLLYAPTNYRWENPDDPRAHVVGKYGVQVVDQLLTHFPTHRIVFRPCVTTWNHPYTLAVIKAHCSHPRFVYSQETDHLPEFSRAATLLTDYSNIGETFAFSSLRPEIRMTLEAPRRHISLFRTGLLMQQADNAAAAVRTALSQSAAFWSSHIAKCFGTMLEDPQDTFFLVCEAIKAILNGQRPPNSLQIARDNTLPLWTKTDYVNNIFSFSRLSFIDCGQIVKFREAFPEDYGALALSLLRLNLIYPESELSLDDRRIVQQIAGDKINLHADISYKILQRLFLMGAQEARKNADFSYLEKMMYCTKIAPSLLRLANLPVNFLAG